MSSLNSLSELLQESGAQFRIYDMGRQISKLSAKQFALIEKGLHIYPKPYLHHAWIALLLWNPKHKQQNVVWFLKFPLDEQGYLVQAVRDDFINRLMLNINQMLESHELSEAEDALKDNPFSFTPDQEKMAVFHAITTRETKSLTSQFYNNCQAYFDGKFKWDQWQDLGIQGIAEVAINFEDNKQGLCKHFNQYPHSVVIALCCALEHSQIDHKLAALISHKLLENLSEKAPNIELCCALLRAMHSAPDDQLKQQLIVTLLDSKVSKNAEVLTTIAIKMSGQLVKQQVLQPFLEQLAVSEAGQQGFSRILADLMFSDHLRTVILQEFRNPMRSEQLALAIGGMFGSKF